MTILRKKEDGEPSQFLSRCLATRYPTEPYNPMFPTLQCWFLNSSTPHHTRGDASAQGSDLWAKNLPTVFKSQPC